MKYYIAYGSNLNVNQMLRRCPEAVKIGASIIEDYKLVFRRGVLNIEPADGMRVPVGVWVISESDEASLDVYEGFPRCYVKRFFRLPVNGKTIEAMAYVMTPGHPIVPPTRRYYETVAEGYADFGFDTAPLVTAAFGAKEGQERFDAEVNAATVAKKAVDAYARKQRDGMSYCPRCGRRTVKPRLATNALSRYADIYICDSCGMDEALRVWDRDPLPLKDWAVAKKRR